MEAKETSQAEGIIRKKKIEEENIRINIKRERAKEVGKGNMNEWKNENKK